MDLFLIRHGEASATWGESSDPGLSRLGQQQSEEAAEALQQHVCSDTLLLSSPLQRARETAIPLARMLRRDVAIEDVFREIPSPVPVAQRQIWLRQFMHQQWGEQGDELLAWRTAALHRLLSLTQPAAVFTHFLVINAVVGQLLDRPDTVCIWPANGSITRLRHNGSHLELLALGAQMETTVN
ncbi:MAG: histidine phosphatase family protein [Halioglobus sp.]|nr:histidine phosphatase family protein [Halioglobus sp.]